MLRSKLLPAAMAAALALGSTAGIAFAANNNHGRSGEPEEAQEAAAVINAKTSLAQAIASAEQQTGGKAIETGLENQDGVMLFEIEIAKGNTVQTVLVDSRTGKVVKVMSADTENGEQDED